jgi:hypothetical protein
MQPVPTIVLRQHEPSKLSKSWQCKAWTQLAAGAFGVLPLYLCLIVLELRSDKQITIQMLILYLAIIAPLTMDRVYDSLHQQLAPNGGIPGAITSGHPRLPREGELKGNSLASVFV